MVETEIISYARAEHHLTPRYWPLFTNSKLESYLLSHFSQLEANRKYVAMVQQVKKFFDLISSKLDSDILSGDIFPIVFSGSLHPLLLLLIHF